MGANRTDGDSLQGLIVPDSRLTYWAAESSGVTQASPYPGAVAATRESSAVLAASGTPENADTLQILATRGGITGYDGARFVWRAGTSGDYYGYDLPLTLADYEVPGFTASIYGYRHPSVLALADGRLILVVDAPTTSPIQAHRVQYAVRGTDNSWSSWVTLHTEAVSSSLSADYLHPVIIERDAGVIEIFHFTYKTGSAQLQRWTSTTGTSWDVDTIAALDASLSLSREMRGIAVSYGAGQYLLQLWSDNRSDISDTIAVYASRDGARFDLQGTISNESRPASAYMPVQGRFITASRIITGTHESKFREAGSAYASALYASAQQTGTAGRQDDELAIGIDNNGRGYILARLDADTVQLRKVEHSISSLLPPVLGNLYESDQESLSEFSASFARGQLIVASNNDEGSPNSAAVSFHGGYADLTVPLSNGSPMSWEYHWLPIDELDRGGIFTITETGTPTQAAAGEFQDCTGSTGESVSYSSIDHFTGRGFCFAHCKAKVSSVNSRYRAFSYSGNPLANKRYGIEVRIVGGASTDDVKAFDAISGAFIAGATVPAGSLVEWLAVVDVSGNGRAWYRIAGSSSETREWNDLANSSSLTIDNTSADRQKTGLIVEAGPTGGASSYDVKIGTINIAFPSADTVDTLIANPANPADLNGRALLPRETYLHDGVSVRAAGLVRGGDSWQITPAYSHAVTQALPTTEPSPARGWRSTGTGATTIAFQVSTLADEEIGPLVGIYLDRHNLTNLQVHVAHGVSSPSWTLVANTELAFGQVDYQRAGATVLPRGTFTGSEEEFFAFRDELAGGYVRFQAGNITREIVRNTEGSWESNSTQANAWPSLQLSGVQGTDPASGAFESTAGIYVHSTRALLLINLPSADRQISGIKVTFGGTYAPPQGYWQIGTLAIGAVHVLGYRPDSTRSRVTEPGEVLEAQPDGSAYAHRQREDARRVEIAWTRSSPTFEAATHDLDYVRARNDASALPVAARFVGPQSFRGLLSEVGRGPIVYVPRIPYGLAQTSVQLHRYAGGSMLCRFVPDSYRLESIGTQLPEEAGEVLRSSVITLEECL